MIEALLAAGAGFLILGLIGLGLIMVVMTRIVAWFLILVCVFAGLAVGAMFVGILLIDFLARLYAA